MFDSLDEIMKFDDATATTRSQRVGKYLVITVCSIVVFSSVYLGLMLLEG